MSKTLLVISIISALLFSDFYSVAQEAQFVPGHVLVQVKPGKNIRQVLSDLKENDSQLASLELKKAVIAEMRIWLVEYDDENLNHHETIRALHFHPDVQIAQQDHKIELRATTPNDPSFSSQWQYINTTTPGGDIDADEAWDITTGGTTADGDEIVVCVLDDGVNTNHPDFGNNLWVNTQEIPNNGVDDDQNGYIDDYEGWNSTSNNDNVSSGGSHGTPCAGICGAQGNNGVGVTGVSWNVKVMMVKNDFNTNESAVLAAYNYPLTMRKLYNQTNGAKGAFVVSTNASWGVDFGQPSNAPLWCAMYDSLGKHGIVSCGATINGNQDVDQIGDLPTACPSDWLISVTNMNIQDVKVTQAGYGATTIDLGAHGDNAYTLTGSGGYGGFGGTSGATPHVTGAIGLLYAAPCPGFMAVVKSDPQQGATLMRQFILNGVDANSSLQGITTTGGRLNLKGSIDLLMNFNCALTGCQAADNLQASNVSTTSATVSWNPPANAQGYTLEIRPLGAPNWIPLTTSQTSHTFNALNVCTEYEFRVITICDTSVSAASNVATFKTDGCCDPPQTQTVNSIGPTSAIVSWSSVTAASAYHVRYRAIGAGSWIIISGVTTLQANLTNLDSCTQYEFQVQTVCGGQSSTISVSQQFRTGGCDACVSFTYCQSGGLDASEEWIANLTLSTINNTTTSNGTGYSDEIANSTILMRETSYPISLSPGFQSTLYDEYFTVWIDLNQDGDFDDVGELVFDAGATSQVTVTGSITIPAAAPLGTTRMRVAMKWSAQSTPCEVFDYGEVEDYCVTIRNSCEEPATIWTSKIKPTSARLNWSPVVGAHHFKIRGRRVGAPNWVTLTIPNGSPNFKDVYGLVNATTYEWQILSVCDATETDLSGWTALTTFTTGCHTPLSTWTTNVSTTGAMLNWDPVSGAEGYEIKGRRVGNTAFISLLVPNTASSKQVFGLSAGFTYEWMVRTICDQQSSSVSDFTPLTTFTTGTARFALGTNMGADEFRVFPNPSSGVLNLDLPEAYQGQVVEINMYNMGGEKQLILYRPIGGIIQIVLDDLPSGIYHLHVKGEHDSEAETVVITR